MDKINTDMMDNTKCSEPRTIGKIERVVDTITTSNYEVENAIVRGLLYNGFIVKTKPIMEKGYQTGNVITVSRIEKVYY